MYTLHLLGSVFISTPTGKISLERKVAGMLAYLALEGPTSKYKLSGWLWPDSGEATAKNNMRQLLRRLRLSGADVLRGEETLELSPEVEVDAGRWSYLESPSLEQLRQDATFLEGLDYDDLPEFAEWVEGTRQEFKELRARAAEAEASRLERAGNFKRALEYAQIHLRLEALSEEGYRQVARLQYLLGDRGAALATLARCRAVLDQELGAEPLPETLQLLRMVEAGSSLPDAPAKPKSVIIPAAVLRPPVLAGREREWALMEEAWERGQAIYLAGDPGAGKTRLALDFAASKGRYTYFQGRPGDSGVPLATQARWIRETLARVEGFAELLPEWVRRELVRLLPELGGDSLPSAATSDEKHRFFEALALVVGEAARLDPATTVVDDLQFFDTATNEVNAYITAKFAADSSPGSPRLVAAYRRGELPPEIEARVNALVDAGLGVKIAVEPLGTEAVRSLLSGLGLEDAQPLAAGLSRYTGGNPLFILETLKYLIETETLEGGLPARLAPQGKVATLIGRRLERLSPSALNLARAAAVAGTEFNLELASAVLERSGFDLAEAHAELETAQILRGNTFVHDLVFEATLAGIPAAVKGLLHSRTARYLQGLRSANPAVIAEHLLAAGDEVGAAKFLIQASERATQASLVAQARAFAERAVAIYRAHADPREYEAVAQLYEVLGINGLFEEMSQATARLVRLARNPKEKVKALANWAYWLQMSRRYQVALDKVEEALEILEPDDLWGEGLLRQTELLCCTRLGRFEQAWKALAAYKTIAERLDNLEIKGSVIEDEGVLLAALDRHPEAIRQFNATLAMIDQHEQFHYAKTRLLSRRAYSELMLGQTDAALADVTQSKESAAQYAVSARGYVWPYTAQASAFLALGRLAEAWAAAQEAERWDRAEPPKVTYLILAHVLAALGQRGRALAELEAYCATDDSHLSARVTARILKAQEGQTPQPLEEAEALLGQIPKPDLQARLRLAKARFAAPEEALLLSEEALEWVAPLGLKPVEAAALTHKAQALLRLGRLEQARAVIEEALKHRASLLSPAQTQFTAFQIFERLGEAEAQKWLEAAQNWIHETAQKLPKDMRAAFLDQPLHRPIL